MKGGGKADHFLTICDNITKLLQIVCFVADVFSRIKRFVMKCKHIDGFTQFYYRNLTASSQPVFKITRPDMSVLYMLHRPEHGGSLSMYIHIFTLYKKKFERIFKIYSE